MRGRRSTRSDGWSGPPEQVRGQASPTMTIWVPGERVTAIRVPGTRVPVCAAVSEQAEIVLYVWLPQFRPVRQLPEFKELLRDVGVVAHWEAYGWPAICQPVRDTDDFNCD